MPSLFSVFNYMNMYAYLQQCVYKLSIFSWKENHERNFACQLSDLFRSARIKSLEARSLCNMVSNHGFSSAGQLCAVTLLVADVSLQICLVTIQYSQEKSTF